MSFKNKPDEAYFKLARDWFYERFEEANIKANRWFLAFLVTSFLLILSIVSCTLLFPLKTLEPMLIHHNSTTGEIWITKPKTPYIPETDSETQSDIVRYIINRESYSLSDINQRFHLVTLLSNADIAKQYADEQSNSLSTSPINTLGEKGTRTIKIEDIIFIDKTGTKEIRTYKQKSQNLAKVDFTTTTTYPNGAKQIDYWVATLGWIYRGLPNNQQDAWDNWNGFQVTTYRVDQRNVTHAEGNKP